MIERITAWLDTHLVPDWRKSWKWPEIQLAALLPVILTAVAENGNFLLSVLDNLPNNPLLRTGLLALLIVIVIATPVVARLVDTEKKTDE